MFRVDESNTRMKSGDVALLCFIFGFEYIQHNDSVSKVNLNTCALHVYLKSNERKHFSNRTQTTNENLFKVVMKALEKCMNKSIDLNQTNRKL